MEEVNDTQKFENLPIDEKVMLALVAKANALQRGAEESIVICGKVWHLRPISMKQSVAMENIDFDVYFLQQRLKETTDRKKAKKINSRIRKAYAKKAAHRVLGKNLRYIPFAYWLTWHRIYNNSEEVSATINSVHELCGDDKNFCLANLGTSKLQLARSMTQVGEVAEQMQKRKQSAESMIKEDASPKKTQEKSATHSPTRRTTKG